MKISYVANIRIPTERAHGVQIMNTCEALVKQGAEVSLFATERENTIPEDPFLYHSVEKIFTIKKLRVPILTSWGKFGFLLQSFLFALAVKKQIEGNNIIYTREEILAYLFSFSCKNVFWEAHAGQWNFFARQAVKRAKGVICISQGLKNFYASHGVSSEKIIVAHDSVDIKDFSHAISREEARQKLHLPLDKKIALYCGSFYLFGWKGVDIAFEAAKLCGKNELFVFVGGDPKEVKAARTIGKENIMIAGFRPHREIPLWLRAADVLLIPNKKGDPISEKFTSPMKLFEYMASGTPIVASDLPSIREVLTDESAFFVEPNDPDALMKGIRRVFSEPGRALSFANRALQDVKKFTWEERADKIVKFLELQCSKK